MSKPDFVYVTYINATPEQVWDALRDPEMTKQYWSHHRNASDWKPGSKWAHEDYADPSIVHAVGEVLEFDPPKQLVMSWANPGELDQPEKVSRVTITIEPALEGAVRVTVIHDQLEPNSKMLKGVSQGWPIVLSSLKSFLETGAGLPGLSRPWRGS